MDGGEGRLDVRIKSLRFVLEEVWSQRRFSAAVTSCKDTYQSG